MTNEKELEALRARAAELEAALGHVLHEVRNALTPAVVRETGASLEAVLRAVRAADVGQKAMLGGTSALDAALDAGLEAALRTTRARVIADAKARVVGLHARNAMGLADVLAALDDAGSAP